MKLVLSKWGCNRHTWCCHVANGTHKSDRSLAQVSEVRSFRTLIVRGDEVLSMSSSNGGSSDDESSGSSERPSFEGQVMFKGDFDSDENSDSDDA